MKVLYGLLAVTLASTAALADLKVATWNIYWLGDGKGQEKSERGVNDYARLSRYAVRLNADIVAVQEVENAEALAKVFPSSRYVYEMANQRGQQLTGFAIKRGVSYRRLDDVTALNTSGGLRNGTVIEVTQGNRKVTMMAVHLKSGCFETDLDDIDGNGEDACDKLEKQVPVMRDWVTSYTSAGKPFVILGDFNRRMDVPGDDLWELIGVGGVKRVNAGIKPACYGGKFKEFIDHIIVSPDLAANVGQGTFAELTFDEEYRMHKVVSDHCPISAVVKD